MPRDRFAIICFDDDPYDVELLQRYLNQLTDWQIDLLAFPDFDAGVRALENRTGDLIILDYLLGSEDGVQILQRLRDSGNDVPVIVITGAETSIVEESLLDAGASQVISKDQLSPDLLADLILSTVAARRAQSSEPRNSVTTSGNSSEVTSRLRSASDNRREDVQEILSLLRASVAEAQASDLMGALPDLSDACDQLDASFEEYLRLKDLEHCGQGEDQESISLSSVVRDVVSEAHFVARRRGVRISYEVDLGLPPVTADPENIACVLACIVKRAIHESPHDAEITVSAKVSVHGDSILVAVRHSQGTEGVHAKPAAWDGELELEGCQDILGRHGGTLWIEPQDAGLAVAFELPIAGRGALQQSNFGERKRV